MLKTIASIAAAGALATVAAAPAQATIRTTGHIGGWDIVLIDEGDTIWDEDVILINGPYGRERITVTCTNRVPTMRWEGYGPNTAQWVNDIAYRWCF